MDYRWDFASVLANRSLLLMGLQNTLILGVVCLSLGLFFGLFVGAARFSGKPIFYYPATAFVEFFRNTPVLVQIIWFFLAFPIIAPFQVNAFTAATLGLTLNTVAFSSEIYRAGLQSIHRGQWEAGKAIGMSYWQSLHLPLQRRKGQLLRRQRPARILEFDRRLVRLAFAADRKESQKVHCALPGECGLVCPAIIESYPRFATLQAQNTPTASPRRRAIRELPSARCHNTLRGHRSTEHLGGELAP